MKLLVFDCVLPLVLVFLLSCHGQDDTCHPVQSCEPGTMIDKFQIGGLLYVIRDDSADDTTNLCPHTDVSQWVIEVVDSSNDQSIIGSYCVNGVPFEQSDVCVDSNGLLAFIDLTNFDNEGVLEVMFSSLTFNTTRTIRYAKPGIVPLTSVIYFTAGEQIELKYLMYIYDTLNDSLIHNGVPLTINGGQILMPSVVKQRFPDTSACQSAANRPESTTSLLFFLNDATIASAGVYQLINGPFSANITLVANFSVFTPTLSSPILPNSTPSFNTSFPTSTTGTTTATIISSPTVSSIASSFVVSMSPSVPASDNMTAIIAGSIVGGFILLLIVISIIIGICLRSMSSSCKTNDESVNGGEHRGGIRLQSIEKKPEQGTTPAATNETSFSPQNGVPVDVTTHDPKLSSQLDSTTISSSSQDTCNNETPTVTSATQQRPPNNEQPHPPNEEKPHPLENDNLTEEQSEEYTDSETKEKNSATGIVNGSTNSELVSLQKENLAVNKQILEMGKETNQLLKDIKKERAESDAKHDAQHKELKEGQEEILESTKSIEGTLDVGFVTETTGSMLIDNHDNSGYHDDHDTSGNHSNSGFHDNHDTSGSHGNSSLEDTT